MVSSCVAYGCTYRAKKASGMTFNLFPKNAEVRKQWKQAVRRESWAPKNGDQLCSVHFTPECFDRTGQTVRLRHGSLLTVFSAFPKYLQKPEKRKRPQPTPLALPATGCVEVINVGREVENGATASPTKEHYKELLHASTEKVTQLQKKVKVLQQNKRRLSRENKVAEEIMKKLKEQNLYEDAVPTLFPDAPKYFTKKAPVKRKDRNICEQRGPAKKRQKPNSVSRQEPEAHVQQQEHEDPNVLPEVETSDAVHATPKFKGCAATSVYPTKHGTS
ncbi:hypothetical protein HPB51_001567 [Rhipicephalus microplus]|uniref:THAP-type domain-containing protein n=1 Tax=Rhipicephalus microplus TaxID=6941 RepID=A0A9J6EW29_RHIMP|nr:hypothetical protein HPB51_001567 [Rhipicephalus microplus]